MYKLVTLTDISVDSTSSLIIAFYLLVCDFKYQAIFTLSIPLRTITHSLSSNEFYAQFSCKCSLPISTKPYICIVCSSFDSYTEIKLVSLLHPLPLTLTPFESCEHSWRAAVPTLNSRCTWTFVLFLFLLLCLSSIITNYSLERLSPETKFDILARKEARTLYSQLSCVFIVSHHVCW